MKRCEMITKDGNDGGSLTAFMKLGGYEDYYGIAMYLASAVHNVHIVLDNPALAENPQ